MPKNLARAFRSVARQLGFDIVKYRAPTPGVDLEAAFRSLIRLRDLSARSADKPEELEFMEFCCANFHDSKSQIFQDLFAQYELRRKTSGFFVEFGATNGVDLSNTHLLEKTFGWRGILAEPGRGWRAALRQNRTCTLDFRCVWDKDGEQLQFNQAAVAELSTVKSFNDSDLHARSRERGEVYPVDTVTLSRLLRDNDAPREIDYMSVDTEGSELKILSAFDFDEYRINVITVEHNYTADRSRINALLTGKGFRRKFESFSLWDDWYVRSA